MKIQIEVSKDCLSISRCIKGNDFYYFYLWYGREAWGRKYRPIEIGFGYWSRELFRLK